MTFLGLSLVANSSSSFSFVIHQPVDKRIAKRRKPVSVNEKNNPCKARREAKQDP